MKSEMIKFERNIFILQSTSVGHFKRYNMVTNVTLVPAKTVCAKYHQLPKTVIKCSQINSLATFYFKF